MAIDAAELIVIVELLLLMSDYVVMCWIILVVFKSVAKLQLHLLDCLVKALQSSMYIS